MNNGTANIFVCLFIYCFGWVPWCHGSKDLLTRIARYWSQTRCFMFFTTLGYLGILCLRAFCFTVSGAASGFLGKLKRGSVSLFRCSFNPCQSLTSELHLHTLGFLFLWKLILWKLSFPGMFVYFTSICRAFPGHPTLFNHSWLPPSLLTVLLVQSSHCEVAFPGLSSPPKWNPSRTEPGLIWISSPCRPSCRSLSVSWTSDSQGGLMFPLVSFQGLLLEHREKEFGDKVNLASVLEAARKIQPQTSASETKWLYEIAQLRDN